MKQRVFRCCWSLFLAFIMHLDAVPRATAQLTTLNGLRIIDEVSFPRDNQVGAGRVHSAIAIDNIGEIVQVSWKENPDHSMSPKEIVSYYGQAVEKSGILDLQAVLPKGMIASQAREFRYGQLLYHAVIGWSFDQRFRDTTSSVAYSLLVFESVEAGESARLIYSEEYINDALEQFIVRDLSQDGTFEIIDRGAGPRDQTASIRLIEADGKVRKIQSFDAYSVSLSLDYPASGYDIMLEEKPQTVRNAVPPRTCSDYSVYRWSAKDKKFVLFKPPRSIGN